MRKQAFTLMEITIVVIILGVLAGISFPQYFKAVEIRKAEAVKTQMKLIETNVNYLLDSRIGFFSGTGDLCNPSCNSNEINSDLEMDVHNSDFDFVLADSYVQATRNGGSFNYNLTLNIGGDIDSISCGGSDCSKIGM